MDGATVSVAVVASRTEAELIVGMLRNNGLRAAVAADDAGGQEPQLQLQGVRVLVAPADEDAARQLIADGRSECWYARPRPGAAGRSAGG
jgi:hypothetical protein